MISKDVCDSQGKTIAIVGFSARAASQIAKKAGFDVVAVDVCADRDLICDCRSHYLLDDPEWPDALNAYYPSAPLLLTGGMEHRTHLVERCHAVANGSGSRAAGSCLERKNQKTGRFHRVLIAGRCPGPPIFRPKPGL